MQAGTENMSTGEEISGVSDPSDSLIDEIRISTVSRSHLLALPFELSEYDPVFDTIQEQPETVLSSNKHHWRHIRKDQDVADPPQ